MKLSSGKNAIATAEWHNGIHNQWSVMHANLAVYLLYPCAYGDDITFYVLKMQLRERMRNRIVASTENHLLG